MPVRPRTAPILDFPPKLQRTPHPISFLRPEAFPGLQRNKGIAGSQANHMPVPEDAGASIASDAFLQKNESSAEYGQDAEVNNGARRSHRPQPHGVFHAHAHDMAYLERWIGDMLDITRKINGGMVDDPRRGPLPDRERLTNMYNEKALRYGIVFDELIRQVAVHSMHLATLVGKAFAGHHTLLTRLIRTHDAREEELQKLHLRLAGLTGESNRKMNEEDAMIEEQAFMENLTKAELRETRALCSSMRVKIKYYGEEVARLRQIVLDKVDDEEDEPRHAKVHNSLTKDGVTMPVIPKGEKTTAAASREPPAREQVSGQDSLDAADDVVTILELSTEKMNMHVRHENELSRTLSLLSTETSKQSSDLTLLRKLVDGANFASFLKGISKEGRRVAKRTKQTQTRPVRDQRSESRPGTGTGSGGKRKPPKKTKGSKTETLPLDLRNSIGMASSPKKIPTLGYMLRTVLDMMLVWSRSLDTAVVLCHKPGGMTEIAIKHFQLLHGMENTTNLMLAQFTAGLVQYSDYKRCKVMGDLLGVDDPTTGPPLDHRAALFLYRLLAELRAVGVFNEEILRERIVKISLNKTLVARATRTVLGPHLPQGSSPVTILTPCLQDDNDTNAKRTRPGEKRSKRVSAGATSSGVPLAKQTVDFDEYLPEVMSAWSGVAKHRASHIHLAFDRYCSTFQVTEEMRFGTDDAPKARDAVIVQLSKNLVEARPRRKLYVSSSSQDREEASEDGSTEPGMMMRLKKRVEKAEEERLNVSTYGTAPTQDAMSWVVETDGEATCTKDYISMNAPVVELLSDEDLALALHYLNPTLSNADINSLYRKGQNIQWDNTHTLFRGLWLQEEADGGRKYWVHTIEDLTQWAVPYNMHDFKREEIDRESFVELCLRANVLDSSPLAPHFLGHPQTLWDGWDGIVAALGRKNARSGVLQDSTRQATQQEEPEQPEGSEPGSPRNRSSAPVVAAGRGRSAKGASRDKR